MYLYIDHKGHYLACGVSTLRTCLYFPLQGSKLLEMMDANNDYGILAALWGCFGEGLFVFGFYVYESMWPIIRGWVHWLQLEHYKLDGLEDAYIRKRMSPSMVSNFLILCHSCN